MAFTLSVKKSSSLFVPLVSLRVVVVIVWPDTGCLTWVAGCNPQGSPSARCALALVIRSWLPNLHRFMPTTLTMWSRW